MRENSAEAALRETAARKEIPFEELREEIVLAIATAMDNPASGAREFWKSVPRSGIVPTPEELVAYIAGIFKMIK